MPEEKTMPEEKSEQGDEDLDNIPSGIPAPHRLGASRKEALALLLGLAVVVAIIASFWFESSR